MKRPRVPRKIEPTWIDHVAMLLGRRWVFALAAGFILTPTHWLIAALSSGVAFLKIDTGARPSALGGAYTALADDVNALYYNPAGLARLTRRELGATHTEWLLGTRFDFLGYAHPTKLGTIGVGLTRLAGKVEEGRDAEGRPTTGFSAADTAYTLGLSRAFGQEGRLGLGANVKFLQSQLGSYSASSFAFDLGAVHRLESRPLTLGLSVLNLGPGMRFLVQRDPLPLTMAAGAAYRLAGALQVALDVRHEVYDRRTSVGIGSEYTVLPALALRAGYTSAAAGTAAGEGGLAEFRGLGGGFGLKLGDYRADYTFTPFGELGNVQRISLGARF